MVLSFKRSEPLPSNPLQHVFIERQQENLKTLTKNESIQWANEDITGTNEFLKCNNKVIRDRTSTVTYKKRCFIG